MIEPNFHFVSIDEMNPVKQALIAFKTSWKESLYLGATATIFTFFSQSVPYAGALLIALGLLIFQEIVNVSLENHQWQMNLSHLKDHLSSLLITSFILMPTGILLGSAFGLLESPQSRWQSLPMSMGLFMLGIYFYLILSHGFRLQQLKHQNIAKSLDIAALSSLKHLKLYLTASFYISIALLTGSLLHGVGFVLSLPFLFYSDYFVFNSVQAQDGWTIKKT